MSIQPALDSSLRELFTEAMSRLVTGLAVVTARGADGRPCGLLVSSLCSYSADPPSLLVSIARSTRSYAALMDRERFGVHLLGAGHETVARTFAGRGGDKFADLQWHWHRGTPRLAGVPVYLCCAVRRVIHEGDHAILVADIRDGDLAPGRPLTYYRRRFDWRLS
ncbi:flavin reductase ActVB/3-hydroxy-9,10-secoandrosta-1,3,5(10)-triene-9,17-dione monooxygenase reductase component [Amycolatopsis xylanica]|uniref:Flavin reductase ActVB/3-hydroxy-9,10-secoandrosta-1,3,5(10)-triene-9,17-dione monooxygenase reductase component n=1 Tax=Amycolatopsis xylanica TaxID=589385 RepID=A0A1H2W763_9PSEU|nr:flavin reductase family protein [Amycolatopsis xylanica]SDW76368.1 flavin reductase ActVB/3-hydroxy-9,10-secoandrosta-1,3,5(10)-triene-9,17-dione monooxygenase reductase component [Amycolatopsis xylanica]